MMTVSAPGAAAVSFYQMVVDNVLPGLIIASLVCFKRGLPRVGHQSHAISTAISAQLFAIGLSIVDIYRVHRLDFLRPRSSG